MTIPLERSAARGWLIVGLVLAIVCGPMLPVAILDLLEAKAPQGWQATRGIIESSGVRQISTTSGRLGVDDFHVPDVRYRFMASDREWRGDTVYRGKGPGSEAAARATAARYPVGASVDIFFDARDPSQAVLEVEVHQKNYHAALAMALGLIVATLCLLRFRLLRRAELGRDVASGPPRLSRARRRAIAAIDRDD